MVPLPCAAACRAASRCPTSTFATRSRVAKVDDNVKYKEDDTQFYSFLPEHPQYNTHEIQCKYLSDFVVPNFIGGTLPHCDQGDHEYYCSTMLSHGAQDII